jgi:hypothetical protein
LTAFGGHLVGEAKHASQLLADPRLSHEGPNASSDNKETLANQILGRLTQRGSADPVPLAELCLRRQRLAWTQLALGDTAHQVLLDLTVKGDAALGVDRCFTTQTSHQGVLTSLWLIVTGFSADQAESKQWPRTG